MRVAWVKVHQPVGSQTARNNAKRGERAFSGVEASSAGLMHVQQPGEGERESPVKPLSELAWVGLGWEMESFAGKISISMFSTQYLKEE